jgi:hypothetical protein
MKTTAITLLLVAFSAGTMSGADEPAPDRPAPQPRPRLQISAQETIAASSWRAAESGVVTLDKMVVSESKLPAIVPRRRDPEPSKFTWQSGGPLAEGKLGNMPVSYGLMARQDLFAEDAAYKSPRTQVEFELVRAKF